ncbi:HXXEE domain-containing protein [Pectobacterium wasabiae]|uniref:Membrane protein n=1 Tax=Pectobacterium wasabiae TaxID=55208 RepID=A0AAW3EIM9_9GAMM|nr:HXXEE domain-containing protein [Pectobacterium wasabiae]AOR61802.1 hypothetical protein A7983_00615 [Pectobacterium wasabiae CFBP 3304]EJS95129.1 Hypothetical protein Y17_1339 [Pectobacterium wasabiae CFBP 3304]KFX08086.1 membrane protein [Pectobacterium wasabiae]KGA30721.1 membrane protein [Pectobacterium wasabiae]
MDFYRRHWYQLGLVFSLVVLVWLVASWNEIGWLHRLSALNFIALMLHQFEEYRWPGGFPAVMNIGLSNSEYPDRYPLNQHNTLVTNVFLAYPFYLLPIFFPEYAWIGIPPILFGLSQFGIHGIRVNRAMKTLYNPGLAAVILGHIPFGLAYIWYGQTHGLISGFDWIWGLMYTAAFALLFRKYTFQWSPDINSKYPFSEIELKRSGIYDRLISRKKI